MIEIKIPLGTNQAKFEQVASTLRQSAILHDWVTLRINGVVYTENTIEYRRAFFEERMKERMWEKLSD